MDQTDQEMLNHLLTQVGKARTMNAETPRPESLQGLVQQIRFAAVDFLRRADLIEGQPYSHDLYRGSVATIVATLPKEGITDSEQLEGTLLHIEQTLKSAIGMERG